MGSFISVNLQLWMHHCGFLMNRDQYDVRLLFFFVLFFICINLEKVLKWGIRWLLFLLNLEDKPLLQNISL